MGVALNRFLGTFIVLENVENRIKTLFWDSHRHLFGGKRRRKGGEESTRAAWRRSWLIGRGNGGILSLPDFGDGAEGPERGMVYLEGSGFGEILSLPEGGGATEGVVERVVCAVGRENCGILSLPDFGGGIEGWTGRWRTMGVALNRFLGTFIVLENVENRIKTLFWDSHRPWFGRERRKKGREERGEE